jgi:transcriptional regulator with XRE-family HTH domain
MTSETLGSRLAAARKRREWSLPEAERRSGVPGADISQIEAGAILSPSMAVLSRLAAAYRIPLRDLAMLAGHADAYPFTRDRRADILARIEASPAYQAAVRDAESESFDGPGIDGAEMIDAATERRRQWRASLRGGSAAREGES